MPKRAGLKSKKSSRKKKPNKGKVHPWRLCSLGRHWVREHDLHIEPSEKNPDGVTIRHGHCADNPSHKDSLYPDEMQEIAKRYFPGLTGPPKAATLGFRYGNKYDELIRGWTKYWNEVFRPQVPLDPNLVKALIATESSFNEDIVISAGKGIGSARGLLQITDQTQKILEDVDGELKDHLVHVNQDEMTDPNLNIAAGIRWLFRKKEIADAQAGKDVSWIDSIMKYKKVSANSKPMRDLRCFYGRLKTK